VKAAFKRAAVRVVGGGLGAHWLHHIFGDEDAPRRD
jgi:hypothetical protein